MQMRKIAYILHGLAAGGTEGFVLNVVKKLDRRKYDITFILALDDDGNSRQFREDEAEALGVHIYRTCDLGSLGKIRLHYKKLKQILKETGPYDVVHGNMDLLNAVNLLAAKRTGIKVRICHSHNSKSQYAVNSLKKVLVSCYRFVMKSLIWHNATIMLGCAEEANDYLYGKRWRNSNKCHVLYNGIDLERFQDCKVDREKYRKELNIPERDGIYLMTVGRFNEQKNPIFLYEIVKEMVHLEPRIQFSWIGNGDLRNKIEERAQKENMQDHIHFLGNRKDVPEIMKCHEGFLLPSLFEGFALVTIEAQAAELKCFCSDRITRDVDCGLCHFISLDKSAKEWAEKILQILVLRLEAEVSKERLERCSINQTVRMLEKYYS
jgi:glycosyltransferase EpsF